jgi:DNA repair protein RecO (recombination protein O)
MAAEKSAALVIRLIDFSETSRIVTLFSEEHGKLTAIAKGAKRPKSPFEVALDLLAACQVVFLPRGEDAMAILTEAKLERRFRGAEVGLPALYAGYYVAELLSALTDDFDPHPELYAAAEATLRAVEQGQRIAEQIVRFEIGLLRLLGHAPRLDVCADSGEVIPRTGRMTFGLEAGGIIRPDRARPQPVVRVDHQAIQALDLLSQPGAAWLDQSFSAEVRGQMRLVLNRYLAHLLGKPLRMHRFLGLLAD